MNKKALKYLMTGATLASLMGFAACSSDSGSDSNVTAPTDPASQTIPATTDPQIVTPEPTVSQKDPGFFVDARDNRTYKTTTIGTQVWMAENLRVKIEGGECWGGPYECTGDPNFYNLAAAEIACPVGWHLPSS